MHNYTCPRCTGRFFSASATGQLRCPYCGHTKGRKRPPSNRLAVFCFVALAAAFIVAAMQVGRYVEKQERERRGARSAYSVSDGDVHGWDRGTGNERF